MWQWRTERLEGSLGPHAEAWDTLARRLTGGNPLLSSIFWNALLRASPEAAVWLAIGQRQGTTEQALCLLHRQRGGQWASFLPPQAQVGPSLLPPHTDLSSLLRHLPGRVLQLDLLCIDPRCTPDPARPSDRVTRSSHALTMSIGLVGGFERYWAARPRKLRENIRRYEHRAESTGDALRLHTITQPEDMPEALRRYSELEATGWKGRAGTAVDESTGQLCTYTNAMVAFAAEGAACVLELWLGTTLVASRLLARQGAAVVALKTCYSEQHRAIAPGRILLKRAIEHAFATWPGQQLEFYTNATPDQLAWSTGQRHVVHLTVRRNRAVAGLALVRQYLKPVRQVGCVAAPAPAGTDGVEVFERFDALPEDVLHLLAKAESIRVSQGADWARLLAATALEPGSRACLYVLRHEGRAVAALGTQEWPAQRRIAALSTFYTAVYAPALEPAIESEGLAPLLRALRRRHGAGLLQFGPMDPHDPAYDTLRTSLLRAGLPTLRYFAHGNRYQAVQGDWPGYFDAREGALRSTIKRNRKKFEAAGGRLELVLPGGPVEAAIAAYEQVYARSWKKPEPHPQFMPGLVRLCAQRGWLRMGIAWVGEQPVAAQLWIVANERAEIYKLAYDEAFKAFAPGTLLTVMLMQHVFEVDQVSEVDYLIGDDAYKTQWVSQRRERWGLVAFDPLTLPGLAGLARALAGRAWRWLRRQPPANGHAKATSVTP